MLPTGIGRQRAGHGGVGDLIGVVGQAGHIEDGILDVVGISPGAFRTRSQPAVHLQTCQSRCANPQGVGKRADTGGQFAMGEYKARRVQKPCSFNALGNYRDGWGRRSGLSQTSHSL
jgi:hypothetical protein